MRFGQKVRLLRTKKRLSQTELGDMCGLSLRTIRNYEVDGRYPKQREIYSKLAYALDCSVNYLLSEEEELFENENQEPNYDVLTDMDALAKDIRTFFNRDDIPEIVKDSLMQKLQDAYWKAKEKKREKDTLI